MNLSATRRMSATAAALLALCVFLTSPLVAAIHHHPAELAGHCSLCVLSTAPLADTADTHSDVPNLTGSEHVFVENDDATTVDFSSDRPARAPPRA